MSSRKPFIVVGIDLAGSLGRPTGVCVLHGVRAETYIAYTDEEILQTIGLAKPGLVTIDTPLSLPDRRKTIHDRSGEHFRDCDRELRRRGIRLFPITLGPMRMLTERGLALKPKIEMMGYQLLHLNCLTNYDEIARLV
jgi:uncharacterized protein